ncbi:hypothetical protein J6590_054209 [Homalodisca vitripennis]|nr:hypothetical protein J6590_054209 [Homalodisca vitripennis]
MQGAEDTWLKNILEGFYSLESDRGCWTEDKSVSPHCRCALRVAVVGNRLFVCRAVPTNTAVPHIRFTRGRVLPLGSVDFVEVTGRGLVVFW